MKTSCPEDGANSKKDLILDSDDIPTKKSSSTIVSFTNKELKTGDQLLHTITDKLTNPNNIDSRIDTGFYRNLAL